MEKRGFEVEAKFRLRSGQREAIAHLLAGWEHERLEQEDRYFDVPGRVLRLRREGESWCLTRKDAPQIAPDGTKTRLEIETPVPESLVTPLSELFDWLGHGALLTVRKVREAYQREGLTVCLDRIAGLADDYAEIEALDPASARQLPALRDRLELGADQVELRSYARILAEAPALRPHDD